MEPQPICGIIKVSASSSAAAPFKNLLEFIKNVKLNNVGFFPYYREEKTRAYYLKQQVSNLKKTLRLKKIQKIQASIADELNCLKIGESVESFVDYFDETTYILLKDEKKEVDSREPD